MQVLRGILRMLPVKLRRSMRFSLYALIDGYRAVFPSRNPMQPPARSTLLVGSGSFSRVGQSLMKDLIDKAGLERDSHVLEIGCGYGRVAVALTTYISASARYDGIDVVEDAVTWCKSEISSRHPNFRFYHAQVVNPYARSHKGVPANEYVFPFVDGSYDLVFLTSVFSHMRPGEIKAYLTEAARLLASGGKIYATFYLIDDEALASIREGVAAQNFQFDFGEFRSTEKAVPEQTIAVPLDAIRAFYLDTGLLIDEPIQKGNWSGERGASSYQDVIVATRP